MGDLDRIQPAARTFLKRNEAKPVRIDSENHPSKNNQQQPNQEHPDIVELHDSELDESTSKPQNQKKTQESSQQFHLDIEA